MLYTLNEITALAALHVNPPRENAALAASELPQALASSMEWILGTSANKSAAKEVA